MFAPCFYLCPTQIGNKSVNSVILLLGSNQGDRCGYLAEAKFLLSEHAGAIAAASSIYETAAWGKTDQDAFLNQAVIVRTELSPTQLLSATQKIEQQLGRERKVRWGSRTLDIDILFFNDEIIDSDSLKVPHPGIPDRRFALVPLGEIAAAKVHPIKHCSVSELLLRCSDPLEVREFFCGMTE